MAERVRLGRITGLTGVPQQVDAEGKTVDQYGLWIGDGGITLVNDGGTVIIDGTSNMFKIQATGTHSVVVSNDSFGEQATTLTGLGTFSATPAHISFLATGNSVSANQHLGFMTLVQGDSFAASSSGGSPTTKFKSLRGDGEAHTNLDGSSQCRIYVTGRNLSGGSVTFFSRYYILQEAAL